MSAKQHIKIMLFHLGKCLGLFHVARRLTRNRLLILGYHGFQFLDEAAFRPILFMRPELFKQRLEILARYGNNVIPLDEAVSRLRAGTLPFNSVVITIDDGFYSVLTEAAPLLKLNNMRSTLYVTSYYADKGTPIFRLAVQYLFWKTKCDLVDLSVYSWAPDGPVDLTDSAAREKLCWQIIDHGESELDEPGRQSLCEQLAPRLDLDFTEIKVSRQFGLMNLDELKQLREFGIDLQLHSHRHRFPTDQRAKVELAQNKAFLNQVEGAPLEHFCYPSGIWHRDHWPYLEAANVRSATTCDAGLNTRDTAPLGLYRILDQDNLPSIEFEAEVCGFVELIRLLTGRRKKSDNARFLSEGKSAKVMD